MTNDFQVEFFSFNHQKQLNLNVCKKDINQVRVNGLDFLLIIGRQNITVAYVALKVLGGFVLQ